jgi:glutathione synthase/RimK-type ligase-like ATP-grasp enzyme
MRIALATCAKLPAHEVDDLALHRALERRGVDFELVAWDEADADWGAFDACLIRTTWDYAERREAFLAWAERAGRATRLFNPPELVRWNTHKRYLAELERAGAPVTPTLWIERGAGFDLRAALAELRWERAFLKPMVGATARETLRFDADAGGLARAEAHIARVLPSEGMMLQPYLSSVETEGERSAVFIDGALSHCVRKVPVPGDYRVQDDFGARDEPCELDRDERALARRVVALACQRFGTPRLLYARVDFLRDDAGAVRLNELELVEPSLFFRHAQQAAERLADGLIRTVQRPA